MDVGDSVKYSKAFLAKFFHSPFYLAMAKDRSGIIREHFKRPCGTDRWKVEWVGMNMQPSVHFSEELERTM